MNKRTGETILIVDDQEENLQIVRSVLSMMDYEVMLAHNGQEAFAHLENKTPDLILLDVVMPEVDGVTVCRQMKASARWADIPIIFLSAADDKNLVVQALEAGGVDFVTKPFNRAELLSRVRTQLALKRSNDQLRMLAEDKDEILGILAHDLKNSLAGMRLSSSLLQSRISELSPRCVPLVENILNATERMLAFMKEFLANQHAEQLQIKLQTVDLCKVADFMVANHQPAAEVKHITLKGDIPADPIYVQADVEGLTQVLENLVSNAVKFTPESGRVEITVDQTKTGLARCFIRDTGPGFTPEDRTKMFRRYGRLSAQPTGDEPSTGLGLSIVKRLMDAMGGTVGLSDRTGPGAEFIVALPTAAPQ